VAFVSGTVKSNTNDHRLASFYCDLKAVKYALFPARVCGTELWLRDDTRRYTYCRR